MVAIAHEGSSAGNTRAMLLAVIAAILLYPLALWLFLHSGRIAVEPGSVRDHIIGWAGVVFFIALAFGLPLMGYLLARANSSRPLTERELFNRRVAHIAFAAPALFTALGSYTRLVGLGQHAELVWVILWLLLGAALFLRFPVRNNVVRAETPPSWIRPAHRTVAVLLVALFLGAHLINHLSALFGLGVQKSIMDALRLWYRSIFGQPALIAGFIFMMASGLTLARYRTVTYTDNFGTLQTLTGTYVAAFLFSHITAAFVARAHGINTNWAWAAGAPKGLFADAVALIPLYSLGVALVIMHLGCGLRRVLLRHHLEMAMANRIGTTVVAAGPVIAVAILSAMLGVRI